MRFAIITQLSLLVAIPALADDAVTIKLKLYAKPGTMQTQSEVSKDSGAIKFLDGDGKVLKEINPNGSETVARDTILKADKDGKPTQFLRAYDKATETEGGKLKAFSYQGKTLLYEKGKDGKFRVGLVGKGKIDRDDGEKLIRNANKPSDSEAILAQLDPKKPVKVGDTWPLDPHQFARAQDVKIDEKKTKMTATLKSVATHGKETFGTFEIDIRLSVTELKDPIQLTFDPPAELTMIGTLELAIDGSSTELTSKFVATMKGDAKATQGGAKGSLSFDIKGDVSGHDTAEEKSPDAGKAPAVTWLAGVGDWSTFKPKDASFHVDFPAGPKEENSKNVRGDSTAQWAATTDAGAVAYIVATTDFAGADPAKVDAKLVLDAVAKNQKDPKNLKDIKQDGFPGIEFDRETSAGGKTVEYHHRVVMVGGRMYQQIVIAEKGKAKPADLEKFFKSFKILMKVPKKDD